MVKQEKECIYITFRYGFYNIIIIIYNGLLVFILRKNVPTIGRQTCYKKNLFPNYCTIQKKHIKHITYINIIKHSYK